jgi:hypothetical protein
VPCCIRYSSRCFPCAFLFSQVDVVVKYVPIALFFWNARGLNDPAKRESVRRTILSIYMTRASLGPFVLRDRIRPSKLQGPNFSRDPYVYIYIYILNEKILNSIYSRPNYLR